MLAVMSTLHHRAAAAADAIEAELKRTGRWSSTRPHPEDFVDMGPFGMNTLAPEQWLQFVLLPRVRQVVASKGEFPADSAVAAWASRNFDGDPDASALVRLLAEFDALFGREPTAPPPATEDPQLRALSDQLQRHLATLPSVKSAWLAQVFFPNTGQLTSPVLGLVLDGPLAPDAFAPLGTGTALVVMAIGDDAVSRLLRLGTPLYVRPADFALHPHDR